jgi:hypothetical protein
MTHLNREELHPSDVVLSFAGSIWSHVGGIWSRVFIVGAGAAVGSRLPAVPVIGKNNIIDTTAVTIAALTTYDCFLHMVVYLLFGSV